MIVDVMRRWFWDSYDSLWRLVVANVAACLLVVCGGWTWLGILAHVSLSDLFSAAWFPATLGLAMPLLCAPWLAGIVHFAGVECARRGATLRDMASGVRAFAPRLFLFLVFVGAAMAVAFFEIWFYVTMFKGPRSIGYGAGVLGTYVLFVAAGAGLHGVGLVVRGGLPLVRALRHSVALTIVHPTFTFCCLGVLAIAWGSAFRSQFAGVILFAFSGTAMMANAMYDVVRDWELHKVRGEPRSDEEEAELRHRYQRTWRELLKPWG